MWSCGITQGAQPSAQWSRRGGMERVSWVGVSGGRRYTYTYGWLMSFYGRNQHNMVRIILHQKIKFKKIRGEAWGWNITIPFKKNPVQGELWQDLSTQWLCSSSYRHLEQQGLTKLMPLMLVYKLGSLPAILLHPKENSWEYEVGW